MIFWDYIRKSREDFEKEYIDTGLVNAQTHPEFPLVPLVIYSYGRKTVHNGTWDEITCRCRGIIVNDYTGEIIARPFEKFFNFGETIGKDGYNTSCIAEICEETYGQPTVWEKLDGFLCTAYCWENKWYVASKGSFDSPHAKWATHWLQNNVKTDKFLPGYTYVFEGITPNLRIVVDYGKEERMVLLACIHNETGGEIRPELLKKRAGLFGVTTPKIFNMTWQNARDVTMFVNLNEEGYVLTWYMESRPPTRLKMKFLEYLRLHRLVTGVSPRRILETLQNPSEVHYLNDMLYKSTPWFAHFAEKWVKRIKAEYTHLQQLAGGVYGEARGKFSTHTWANMGEERKAYALFFNEPQNKEVASICFALLDGKDTAPIIWKLVKGSKFMKGTHPMVDAHTI